MVDKTKQEQEQEEDLSINTLWVFTIRPAEGKHEAIVALPSAQGGITPLIADKEKQLDGLRKTAQEIANEAKQDITLLKFDRVEELERITHNVIKSSPPPKVVH